MNDLRETTPSAEQKHAGLYRRTEIPCCSRVAGEVRKKVVKFLLRERFLEEVFVHQYFSVDE